MNDKKYKVIYNKNVKKQVLKLDPFVAKKIKRWIDDNLVGCSDPHFSGKQFAVPFGKLGDLAPSR